MSGVNSNRDLTSGEEAKLEQAKNGAYTKFIPEMATEVKDSAGISHWSIGGVKGSFVTATGDKIVYDATDSSGRDIDRAFQMRRINRPFGVKTKARKIVAGIMKVGNPYYGAGSSQMVGAYIDGKANSAPDMKIADAMRMELYGRSVPTMSEGTVVSHIEKISNPGAVLEDGSLPPIADDVKGSLLCAPDLADRIREDKTGYVIFCSTKQDVMKTPGSDIEVNAMAVGIGNENEPRASLIWVPSRALRNEDVIVGTKPDRAEVTGAPNGMIYTDAHSKLGMIFMGYSFNFIGGKAPEYMKDFSIQEQLRIWNLVATKLFGDKVVGKTAEEKEKLKKYLHMQCVAFTRVICNDVAPEDITPATAESGYNVVDPISGYDSITREMVAKVYDLIGGKGDKAAPEQIEGAIVGNPFAKFRHTALLLKAGLYGPAARNQLESSVNVVNAKADALVDKIRGGNASIEELEKDLSLVKGSIEEFNNNIVAVGADNPNTPNRASGGGSSETSEEISPLVGIFVAIAGAIAGFGLFNLMKRRNGQKKNGIIGNDFGMGRLSSAAARGFKPSNLHMKKATEIHGYLDQTKSKLTFH
jgi:hypothetical protein